MHPVAGIIRGLVSQRSCHRVRETQDPHADEGWRMHVGISEGGFCAGSCQFMTTRDNKLLKNDSPLAITDPL